MHVAAAPPPASRHRAAIAGATLFAAFALCAPVRGQGAGNAALSLDGNMIVDCLLPGVVRKLGANVTYLTPRKVAKATVKECEVRGGEYVLFDRSDPATALKIWRPAAEQGDAVSQFRVGQIYEMGLGGSPDYQAAALWYKKAADQGNRSAAFNLAVLYEKGLGVNRDNAAALALYRKAQGLTDDIAGDQDVRVLRESLKQAQQRISQLEHEVAQLKSGVPATDQSFTPFNLISALLSVIALGGVIAIGLRQKRGAQA